MNYEIAPVKVYTTVDYDALLLHDLQPSKRVGVSTALVQSLIDTDGNKYQPVLVSKKTNQLIDGHRRVHASRIAETPVHFVCVSVDNEEVLMKKLNSTSRSWSTLNYIDHFAKQDVRYSVLQEYMTTKKASIELIKLFSNVDTLLLQNGGNISSINYAHIEKVRKLVLVIAGIFDINKTIVIRAIAKLRDNNESFSIVQLKRNIIANQRDNKYAAVTFVSNQRKLVEVLEHTYKGDKHDKTV